jgi:hypothetical protein
MRLPRPRAGAISSPHTPLAALSACRLDQRATYDPALLPAFIIKPCTTTTAQYNQDREQDRGGSWQRLQQMIPGEMSSFSSSNELARTLRLHMLETIVSGGAFPIVDARENRRA